MTAITEESLGVSGILLAKVFHRSDAKTERYRRENARQTRLQLTTAMSGRRGHHTDRRDHHRVHDPAGEAADAAGPAMRVTLDVQTSLTLFRRLFEYLDLVPAIQDAGAVPLDPATVCGGRQRALVVPPVATGVGAVDRPGGGGARDRRRERA